MGADRWDEKKHGAVEERQERHEEADVKGVRNAVKENKEHKVRSPFAEGDS